MKLRITINAHDIEITNEHAASSHGIPVAVIDGKAYGPADELPIWDEMDKEVGFHLRESAAITVAAAISKMDDLEDGWKNFARAFYQ